MREMAFVVADESQRSGLTDCRGRYFLRKPMRTDPKNGGKLLVILLDDDPYDVELMQTALEAGVSCRVVAVSTRLEFIASLEVEPPDVIISDSNIPSFDGLVALPLAHAMYPEVPFIFCSGNASPELKAAALARGAKDWVSKNDLDALIETVRQVAGH
jgi:CheY-like chemotaxis protein